MTATLLVILSVFTAVFSKKLFSIAFGDMRFSKYMPHTHLWFVQFILFSLIGANLMVLGIRGQIISNFITNEETYYYVALAVCYSMISIPLSIIIFNKIFYFNIYTQLTHYLQKNVSTEQHSEKHLKMFFFMMSMISVSVVVYLCYYNAPLYLFLTNRIDRLLIARVQYTHFFEGSALIKNVIGQALVPLTSYICFSYYLNTRNKSWRNLFAINFLCALFISGASMSKSGMALYFLPFIFILVIMNKKISIKNMLVVASAMVLILASMYTIQYAKGDTSTKEVLFDFHNGPIGRILYVQIQSLAAYFEIFPDDVKYLMGRSIAIFRYLGIEFADSARIVSTYLEPVGVSEGWVGVANTLFLGDAFANFGVIGLALSPVWMALVYSFFYWRMVTTAKTPLRIGYYAFILMSITNSATGGFFAAYVINTRIIAAIIFMGFIGLYLSILENKQTSLIDRQKQIQGWNNESCLSVSSSNT